MTRSLPILLTIAGLFVLGTSSESFSEQIRPAPRPVVTHPAVAKQVEPKMHHVVIQVTQNDPALMTIALNNAENLTNYYQQKGERLQLEFVAYGPGLHMLRSDTSPVSDRIKRFAEKNKQVTFSGCGNTLNTQSKQENKELTLLPEARIVPAGIARITELQEQGWTYVRP
jgi:uncharacterized protein